MVLRLRLNDEKNTQLKTAIKVQRSAQNLMWVEYWASDLNNIKAYGVSHPEEENLVQNCPLDKKKLNIKGKLIITGNNLLIIFVIPVWDWDQLATEANDIPCISLHCKLVSV